MQDKKIKLDDFSRGIDTGLDTADEQRADALERLHVVRQTKATSLRREQARLALKYGAEHPRVQTLAARATHNQALLHDLVTETVRARTAIPSATDTGWVLHGFVRDADGNGLAKLTVALYDTAEPPHWLDALGYACTCERGYFKLVVGELGNNAGAAVHLHVLNDQGATLHRAHEVLTLDPGDVVYREIIIGDEQMYCPPPPPTPGAGAWTVRGHVNEQTGAALPGLTVSISDQAGKYAARLGKQKTGAAGEFEFKYKADDFADLIKAPVDLFLRVLDANQRPVYTHQPALHFAAGKIDDIPIVLGKTGNVTTGGNDDKQSLVGGSKGAARKRNPKDSLKAS